MSSEREFRQANPRPSGEASADPDPDGPGEVDDDLIIDDDLLFDEDSGAPPRGDDDSYDARRGERVEREVWARAKMLTFGPPPGDFTGLTTVLWPTYAWNVVAPRFRESPFDLFQRAVLRLWGAGIVSKSALSEELALHPDLIESVLEALKTQGLIEGETVADAGRTAIRENRVEETETAFGWILQDAVAGEVLPQRIDGLKGLRHWDDKKAKTYRVHPNPAVPRPPSPESIREALTAPPRLKPVTKAGMRRCRGESFNFDAGTDRDGMSEESDASSIPLDMSQPGFLPRILSTRPLRVLLPLRVRSGLHLDGGCEVICPYPYLDSARWHRLLRLAIAQDEELDRLVFDLREEGRKKWWDMNRPQMDGSSLSRMAAERVSRRFGEPPIPAWGPLWDDLRLLEETRELHEQGIDVVDTALTRGNRCLERVVGIWFRNCPLDVRTAASFKTREAFSGHLVAALMGFGATSSDLPERITNVDPEVVAKIIRRNSRLPLLPAIAGIIADAALRPGFNRRVLIAALGFRPSLFRDIESIEELRNNYGAHAGGPLAEVRDEISEGIQLVFDVVAIVVDAIRTEVMAG